MVSPGNRVWLDSLGHEVPGALVAPWEWGMQDNLVRQADVRNDLRRGIAMLDAIIRKSRARRLSEKF